jgi:membrane protein YdbS with pleckstrin-like domain
MEQDDYDPREDQRLQARLDSELGLGQQQRPGADPDPDAKTRKTNTPEEEIWTGQPSWQGMLPWYLKAFLLAAAIDLVTFLASSVGLFSLVIWVLILVVSVAAVLGIGWLTRQFTHYTITTKRLIVTFGVLNRQEHATQLRRVQNTTIQQKLWERALGVGSIDIDTAGYSPEDTTHKPFLLLSGIRNPQKVAEIIDEHTWSQEI